MKSYSEVIAETSIFGLEACLLVAALLFGIGCIGVVVKRNLIVTLMSVEIMLNAVNLVFLAFSLFPIAAGSDAVDLSQHREDGQYFVLLVIAVAAVEAAVGLAILVSVYRTRRNIDTANLQGMGG